MCDNSNNNKMARDVETTNRTLAVGGAAPRDLDQFFTNARVVRRCLQFLDGVVPLREFARVLEPAAGDGAFVRGLLKAGVPRSRIEYADVDALDPRHRADFLADPAPEPLQPGDPPLLVVGNPPFGTMGRSAVQFFNRAAAMGAAAIAFIVPASFGKDSVQARLDRRYHLFGEMALDPDSFTLGGQPYCANCIFQVWAPTADGGVREVRAARSSTADFELVRRDASPPPHFAVRRVGALAGTIFEQDVAGRSASSHLFVRVRRERSRARVLRRMRRLNLLQCEERRRTVANPSICGSELVRLYEALGPVPAPAPARPSAGEQS